MRRRLARLARPVPRDISQLTARAVSSGGSAWMPGLLLTGVAALDVAQNSSSHSLIVMGLLDEPAHLATASLALLALRGHGRLVSRPAFAISALIFSMAIDADHIPLYAAVPHISAGGRPYSHSLATALALIVGWAATGRKNAALSGAATGVILHFVRDIATGPGLPLWWPLRSEEVRLPYAWYAALLAAFTVIATGRALLSADSIQPDAH